jgi:hypothetical protein
MAGKADIVFCLDASASMQPCLDGVKKHLGAFFDGLAAAGQMPFDCRLDFVAHCAGEAGGGTFYQRSVFEENLLEALYFGRRQGRFFTRDPADFKAALGKVQPFGDEAPLVALDSCLDFPWSDDPRTHRVVIQLTDEPFETGVCQEVQRQTLPRLMEKIQKLGVLLFLVGPESELFDRLSAVDRSEYQVVGGQGDGLANVDFRAALASIGRSVSVSRLQSSGRKDIVRGLFGQPHWSTTDRGISGA